MKAPHFDVGAARLSAGNFDGIVENKVLGIVEGRVLGTVGGRVLGTVGGRVLGIVVCRNLGIVDGKGLVFPSYSTCPFWCPGFGCLCDEGLRLGCVMFLLIYCF